MYVIMLKGTNKTNVEKVEVAEKELSLKTMRELIGCQWIETVLIKDVFLVFDEEYLLTHSKPLPNFLPSLLHAEYRNGSPICGNVLLCKEEDGEMVAVEEEYADVMVAQLNALQEVYLRNQRQYN